jgi:hypothetical protein
MSVSRSVQAAQRRRAGPPEPQYQNKNRGPVASINSAQTFNTQHNTNPPINVEKNSKLSIPQAITLITLRLGSLETNLDHISQELVNGSNHETTDNMKMVDGDVLTNIMNRLEALETSDDKNVLDTVKRGVIQNKTNHTKLRKDFKNLQDKVEDINLILTSMTMEEDVEENVEDEEENVEDEEENVEDIEYLKEEIENELNA